MLDCVPSKRWRIDDRPSTLENATASVLLAGKLVTRNYPDHQIGTSFMSMGSGFWRRIHGISPWCLASSVMSVMNKVVMPKRGAQGGLEKNPRNVGGQASFEAFE